MGLGFATAMRQDFLRLDAVYRSLDEVSVAWRHENSQLFTVLWGWRVGETFRAATPESRVCEICLLLTGQQCGGCSLKRQSLPEWACTMDRLRDSGKENQTQG
jgi:hypothetical protein